MSFNYLNLLTKGKRSQSALEYMMTYGWAILIIVIVAVILYSMGIFNPSSSISTTITGFSSTPVSSAIFTDNGGLSLSVQNSVGYPIEITNITATTTTGGKVTIEPNITLLPGKSQVLVLSKLFTAANQGSHISTAVTITYKEISQQLPGPYISTGSITGSTPTVIYPANYTFAAVSKLTITNKQSSATPSPFQQMVNITSADNGWQLISNGNFGQNVEFFYSNGTVIPSWLESYSSSNAIWWLKLGSIPASSSITVYMGIAPTSTNLFNTVNDGEAPQLSSTYAEYDDGANIFNYYTNFAGTSLPSGWTTSDTAGISINNGVQINAGSVYTTSPVFTSTNSVEEMYAKYTALNSANYSGIMQSNTQFPQDGNSGSNAEILWMTNGGSNEYSAWSANGSSANYNIQNGILLNFIPNLNQFYIIGTYINDSIIGEQIDYIDKLTASGTFDTSQYVILGCFQGSGCGSFTINPLFVQWVRVRAYPPNGVMPSVSFGSVA